MKVTRVEKFKEYRNSAIKEDVHSKKNQRFDDEIYVSMKTTSTLPYGEVISELEKTSEEKALIIKQRNQRILKYTLVIAGLVVLVAGLVIFGILVWRK